MKYIVHNIKNTLDENFDTLKKKVAKKLGIKQEQILNLKITKESVDARRKPNINLVYSVVVETNKKINLKKKQGIKELVRPEYSISQGTACLDTRPVIIGTGPCGLFTGLLLSYYGYKPIIFERGESVENRSKIVNKFWKTGTLDQETNVQFGEGGAGTFSDGKLTTRINDRLCDKVLNELCNYGAPKEILFKSKPHIGSDRLINVVKNIRNKIIENGGEVHFNSKLTSITTKDNKLTSITINGNNKIDTNLMILAIGHSSRDTFKMLLESGLIMERKPFSMGVRIEHPQSLINQAQYGSKFPPKQLGPAEYQLFYKTQSRTAYSFCMCPGGVVVSATSESEGLVTNGMSYYNRNFENANSALVVSVNPTDFKDKHPLSGIEFQRHWENLAYNLGGKNYSAPIQRLEDFINDTPSTKLGTVVPSFTGEKTLTNLNDCLPQYVTNPMKESIPYFDNMLKGFNTKDAILTGVETRTSSPVRIPRNNELQSTSIDGIYPAGEGAGYAGGIMSAAVDGLKIAEKIIQTFKPTST